jgi:hypothetical protein
VTHPANQKSGRIQLWYAPDRGEFVKLSGYHDGAADSSALSLNIDDVQFSTLAFEVVGAADGSQATRSESPRPTSPGRPPTPTAPSVTIAPPVPAARPAPTPPAGLSPQASSPSSASSVPPLSRVNIAIAIPRDLAEVTEDRVPLAGIVTGQDIAQVIVALNGGELVRLTAPSPQSVVPLNVPLPLSHGRNTLVVTAITASGDVQQEIRSVFRQVLGLRITYRVTGSPNLVRITFRSADGRRERTEAYIPVDTSWSVSFDVAEGSPLELDAELADDEPGMVSCQIAVVGRIVSEQTQEGKRLASRCAGKASP